MGTVTPQGTETIAQLQFTVAMKGIRQVIAKGSKKGVEMWIYIKKAL